VVVETLVVKDSARVRETKASNVVMIAEENMLAKNQGRCAEPNLVLV
jgi:hypothetical protein